MENNKKVMYKVGLLDDMLRGNLVMLNTQLDVCMGIALLLEAYGGVVPISAVEDVNRRIADNPRDVEYAKQQLRYLIRWVNKGDD